MHMETENMDSTIWVNNSGTVFKLNNMSHLLKCRYLIYDQNIVLFFQWERKQWGAVLRISR